MFCWIIFYLFHRLYLTHPTFFSELTAVPPTTLHDEYWHEHVDKVFTLVTTTFTCILMCNCRMLSNIANVVVRLSPGSGFGQIRSCLPDSVRFGPVCRIRSDSVLFAGFGQIRSCLPDPTQQLWILFSLLKLTRRCYKVFFL